MPSLESLCYFLSPSVHGYAYAMMFIRNAKLADGVLIYIHIASAICRESDGADASIT